MSCLPGSLIYMTSSVPKNQLCRLLMANKYIFYKEKDDNVAFKKIIEFI